MYMCMYLAICFCSYVAICFFISLIFLFICDAYVYVNKKNLYVCRCSKCMNIYVKDVFLFIESFLFIYRKFLYMTMDIYSIYMRNDDPHGKVLYMQKLQF